MQDQKNSMHQIKSPIRIHALTICLFIVPFLLSPAIAHKGATGVVKERMDLMDETGKNMKAIKGMMKGKIAFDSQKMTEHAESIRQASTHIKMVFPEGSLKGKSEALPAIWKNWEKFSMLTERLTAESTKLKEVAGNSDRRSIMKQFAKVGKTCRNCHTDFRKKKDKKK
ncbi:MAG: cytochrome c [Gammaproteobacteria bacterium]|jgi:cytochrome c556|nr:cytochrome c [Gammaproteobacteria bacterium]MBT3722697.1 cytochrome c [Gammaproteobacteria bacterium]MBT4078973.1 cytochrome c [Gammaproteobacteria bacterium]MBT4194700.1 cytochrome c [Gammaproteobacteria bacterium]MBT4450768.1 cytochrome c [Gammaproteobacteria bacterium]